MATLIKNLRVYSELYSGKVNGSGETKYKTGKDHQGERRDLQTVYRYNSEYPDQVSVEVAKFVKRDDWYTEHVYTTVLTREEIVNQFLELGVFLKAVAEEDDCEQSLKNLVTDPFFRATEERMR